MSFVSACILSVTLSLSSSLCFLTLKLLSLSLGISFGLSLFCPVGIISGFIISVGIYSLLNFFNIFLFVRLSCNGLISVVECNEGCGYSCSVLFSFLSLLVCGDCCLILFILLIIYRIFICLCRLFLVRLFLGSFFIGLFVEFRIAVDYFLLGFFLGLSLLGCLLSCLFFLSLLLFSLDCCKKLCSFGFSFCLLGRLFGLSLLLFCLSSREKLGSFSLSSLLIKLLVLSGLIVFLDRLGSVLIGFIVLVEIIVNDFFLFLGLSLFSLLSCLLCLSFSLLSCLFFLSLLLFSLNQCEKLFLLGLSVSLSFCLSILLIKHSLCVGIIFLGRDLFLNGFLLLLGLGLGLGLCICLLFLGLGIDFGIAVNYLILGFFLGLSTFSILSSLLGLSFSLFGCLLFLYSLLFSLCCSEKFFLFSLSVSLLSFLFSLFLCLSSLLIKLLRVVILFGGSYHGGFFFLNYGDNLICSFGISLGIIVDYFIPGLGLFSASFSLLGFLSSLSFSTVSFCDGEKLFSLSASFSLLGFLSSLSFSTVSLCDGEKLFSLSTLVSLYRLLIRLLLLGGVILLGRKLFNKLLDCGIAFLCRLSIGFCSVINHYIGNSFLLRLSLIGIFFGLSLGLFFFSCSKKLVSLSAFFSSLGCLFFLLGCVLGFSCCEKFFLLRFSFSLGSLLVKLLLLGIIFFLNGSFVFGFLRFINCISLFSGFCIRLGIVIDSLSGVIL